MVKLKFIQLKDNRKNNRRETKRYLKDYFLQETDNTTLKDLREHFDIVDNDTLYEHLELINTELFMIDKQDKHRTYKDKQRINKEKCDLLSNITIM